MRYWKRVNLDGSTRTVEAYSHNLDIEGAIEISKSEITEYLNSHPKPKPSISLMDRVRDLEAKVKKLEGK